VDKNFFLKRNIRYGIFQIMIIRNHTNKPKLEQRRALPKTNLNFP